MKQLQPNRGAQVDTMSVGAIYIAHKVLDA